MGRSLNSFDKQALVTFLVDGANVAAVDLQVRQAQARQVTDHAEPPTETLQAEGETQLAQALGHLFQHGLLRQLLFTDLQGKARAQVAVLT